MSGAAAEAPPLAGEAAPTAVPFAVPEIGRRRTATPSLEAVATTTSTGFVLPLAGSVLAAGALFLAVQRIRMRARRSR
jgi:hypothetical protein